MKGDSRHKTHRVETLDEAAARLLAGMDARQNRVPGHPKAPGQFQDGADLAALRLGRTNSVPRACPAELDDDCWQPFGELVAERVVRTAALALSGAGVKLRCASQQHPLPPRQASRLR